MPTHTYQTSEPELQVDLSAIAANFHHLRSLVGSNTEVAAVVKSDAYGLGMNLVVPVLLEAGCHTFFVANLREAMQIRTKLASSVRINILAGIEDNALDVYRTYRLAPVCGRLEDAILAAEKLPELVLSLETGFSRFGLTFAQARAFKHMVRREPDLAISHLACADDPIDTTNRLQRDRFVAMCQIVNPRRRSLAASAAVWLGQNYHFNLVRAGSALFGLNNAGVEPNPLRPVVQLFARLAEVRAVHCGEVVGYAASFRATRSMRIGIVALGYAQGLPWSAGNVIAVLIGAHKAPVVGRVAMEYVAVDLSDVPAKFCTEGQFVEFIGPHLPIETMAKAAHTIPQELLIRLGANCRPALRQPCHDAPWILAATGG